MSSNAPPNTARPCPTCTEDRECEACRQLRALIAACVTMTATAAVRAVPLGPGPVCNAMLRVARQYGVEEDVQRAIDETLAMSVDEEDLPRC